MTIKQKIKKWHVVVLIILGIGGYWLSQNMWVFEKQADLKTFDGRTISNGTTFRGNIQDFGGGDVALDLEWYKEVGLI